MKKPTQTPTRLLADMIGAVLVLAVHCANAQFGTGGTYFEPSNGGVLPGVPLNGGSYSWDTTNWASTTATGLYWQPNGFASFSAGALGAAYTVTVNADETMTGIYASVSGQSITINSAGVGALDIASGDNGFEIASSLLINAPIVGNGGVAPEILGSTGNPSRFYLNGNNTYSGGTVFGYTALSPLVYFNNSSSFGTGDIRIKSGSTTGLYYSLLSTGGAPITLANNFDINRSGSGFRFGDASNTPITLVGNWTLGANSTLIRNSGGPTSLLTISGAINGTGGVTFSADNDSSILLTGSNTYSGATTLGKGLTAVTLKLGAANTIASSSDVILAGGSLDSSGLNHIMSSTTLDLTDNSTIDFTGTSEVDFADSSSRVWTSGKVLNLAHWDSSDKLRFGTDAGGLAGIQLSQIEINGNASTLGMATLDANGYLVVQTAPLALTNYTTANPLRIMAIGDSITDDSSTNGAWRFYLEPLLNANGYAFTNVGRWLSASVIGITQLHHEGMDSAVIGAPGVGGSPHGYSGADNYSLRSVADALTNSTADLFLIDMGVNDMGRGRDPYLVATNHLSALLDLIFSNAPSAHIIVGKPTTISKANILSPPYLTYATNMYIFCDQVQALAAARRFQGQNVFVADFFSVVDPSSMFKSDGTHPNPPGLIAMANEWMLRIGAITTRPDLATTPFVFGGSTWKYSDQGLNLGTNWAQPNYDDSTWAQGAGRLGYGAPGVTTTVSYGPSSTSKYITTYFRHSFVVPTNVYYTNLILRLNRADGAAVWLNGRELLRMNLPSGAINYQTHATANVAAGDPLNTYYPTNFTIASLPSGTNVVAVEIHRGIPSQPYLTFDLEMFGQGGYLPMLAGSIEGQNFKLRWPTIGFDGFGLETAFSMSSAGAWQPIPGPYPQSNGLFEVSVPTGNGPAQFFRLRKP